MIVGNPQSYPTLTEGQVIQAKNKQNNELTDTINQMNLTDIFRTIHTNKKEIHFS